VPCDIHLQNAEDHAILFNKTGGKKISKTQYTEGFLSKGWDSEKNYINASFRLHRISDSQPIIKDTPPNGVSLL